ncbi:hypothetical protein Tco_0399596, partial [Tanacetum coccineum]
GGSFEITSIFALSTSSPASDTLHLSKEFPKMEKSSMNTSTDSSIIS